MSEQSESVVILGAGPSGLAAALELTNHAIQPTVLEKGPYVGVLSATHIYKGFRYDVGGASIFHENRFD